MSDYLDDYYQIAQGFIDLYADRNALFQQMDEMYYNRWIMPEGMPDWVMKVVSTDPHDAILTTVRTFATLKPRFKVMPMLNNEANRDRANQIETALAYNFKQASRRSDASITWDIMMSSSLYAEVAAQVIYLPYQEKVLEVMGKDTKRIKAAKRFGDFAFIIHNPANIYPEWSEYGLEGVMAVRVQTVDEFMDTWGELASRLVTEKEYTEGKITYVTSFDYTTHEKRCVWGVCGETDQVRASGVGIKILEEDNKLGFIPYAIRRWGNSLSINSDERVMPLLQSIYQSGQWDMLNVFESLDASLAMKRAAQPQYAGEFPPGQEPLLDNTEPVGVTKLPQGTRNFTPLPAQSVDNRIEMQKQGFRNGIWQSSVSRVLQTLDTGSGESFSSFNQRLSSAANSLSPYKMIGEMAHSELAYLMLCWVKYYGKEHGKTDLYGVYDDKTNMGKEVRIGSDTIDPDAVQVDVVLTADLPVDQLQRINAAVLVKQNFSVPEAELIEDLGYGDPTELAKRRHVEDYKAAYIQTDLRQMQLDQELAQQEKIMKLQAGIAQQQQADAAAQEEQARAAEANEAAAAQGGAPSQQAEGLGANPAMQGMPPTQMGAQQA